MTTGRTASDLLRLGRVVHAREAVRRAVLGASAAAALLSVLAALDLFFRYERAGRVVCFAVLAAVAVTALGIVLRALMRRVTPEGIAARLEKAFPDLDNRLINFVQFSGVPEPDAMVAAYLGETPPDVGRLSPAALGNRRAAWIAAGALAVAAAMTGGGWWWSGPAWANAVLRVANPLSARSPATLARIVAVEPGSARALSGRPLVLAVRAEGKAGQPVSVELWPADDRRAVVEVGRLAGRGEERFEYPLPRLTGNLGYRFRAGDALAPRHTVTAVPPPAFARLTARVTPPDYLQATGRVFDVLKERIAAPQGSTVRIEVEANRDLAAATAASGSAGTGALARAASGALWTGSVAAAASGPLTFTIADADGFGATCEGELEVAPDQPPVIRILTPASRVKLGPGALPRIQWEVTDDHGIAAVALEQIFPGDTQRTAVAVADWPLRGEAAFRQLWDGADAAWPEGGRPLVYRVTATDNLPGARAPRAVSTLVYFDPAVTGAAVAAQAAVAASGQTLAHMVELQRKNLEKTTALEKAGGSAPEAWDAVRGVQEDILRRAGALLADPVRPLGALEQVVRDLQAGPMREAVGVVARVPKSPDAERPVLARRAVALEGAILRALTAAEEGMARVAAHKQLTGLFALLDALVQGQGEVLETSTKAAAASASVPKPLVDRQDRLAEDTGEFVRVCRRDMAEVAKTDAGFAALVGQVATECETRKVAPTMIAAAGHLEGNDLAKAVPLQTQALAHLKEFQALLNKWRALDAQEKADTMGEAVAEAADKMKKLTGLHAKIVDAIRQTEQQKDHSGKDMEALDEELGELKANMAESLLKIATDLHIFPELPVGNDMVADVFQIYEEVAQVPGSESAAASELGLQKEDWILEALETATERLDDMEMWLVAQPDATKRNTENFDQQELPEIPVIPLASEIEDIIGDLLEQEEEIMNESDDSATNQGSADMAAGWGIAEGEFANFSAKGKSGNERPDHKDQDGRSLVGRQGMADGETVAGSGKINEGDNNIEARRTQDSPQSGQVQEEGHADAKATGGGKGSGYSDRLGMSGTGPREDAKTQARSELGLQAMLRRNAEALYAKASMAHIRTGNLDEAVRAMRQAEDAMRNGASIREVREYQRRAAAALAQTKGDLGPGVFTPVMAADAGMPLIGAQEASTADDAPPAYRDLVSEYFRSLSEVAR
ncbi:MAG: hypothetical protein FJ221_02105 [Lentisphaerae bacterium]|nr:hypothetical protein [Lentisphaerota bacterium]